MGELAHPGSPASGPASTSLSFAPLASKRGVTVGMAMTEKQGGSDLRANTTRAEPDGEGDYRLIGHKWFCSAPMSDAFLTLAQAPERAELLPGAAHHARRRAQCASS